ncbi:hypothetical protein GF359_03970 [candidate division WOR-3 bacterium]|uniref:Uncharacterized protein n=1 Tax=candidate division WOR-3 bacterium TaxID=2052148 RepID=A0A9D5K9Y9_UNCW3|nr:hypothetical protein [candidate division WOR-3 bacterium]MBD3364354.1 hypothetical protein [candidate division WOR-3 bacterium]
MSIILPLPENLSNLLEEQEEARKKTIVMIAEQPDWQEHIQLIHDSMNIVDFIAIKRIHQNENELILRGLAARLFNDYSAAFDLLLTGYYQVSLMVQRDIFECALLLSKFALDRDSIQRWKNVNPENNQEKNEFRPNEIRKLLKESTGIPVGNTSNIDYMYKLLCELGVHPTYIGINSLLGDDVGKNRLLKVGPMINKFKFRSCLSDFVRISAMAAGSLVDAFNIENLEEKYRPTCKKHRELCKLWFTKHGTFPGKLPKY